jgi:uncharacterized protein (TIGR02246 family)
MTGPAEEKSIQSDDETAIRKLVDTWLAASKAGDISTMLSLMTDDVTFMVPGREPFGKEAFAAASGAMQNVRVEGNADIRELRVLGDWAYMRNYLEMTITPEDGAPMKRSGWTLTILRKGEARWLLARDANLLIQTRPPEANL